MKRNKFTTFIYFFAAVCFYLAALILFFTGGSRSISVMWFCLGSAMLCFGSIQLNKSASDKSDVGTDDLLTDELEAEEMADEKLGD